MSILLAVIVGVGVSYTGYLGGLMTMGGSEAEPSTAAQTNPGKTSTPGTRVAINPALIEKGKQVYSANGCANCHRLNGKGGNGGPDLSREGDRNADVQWQTAHLKNPAKLHPGSFMPAYNKLSDADLNALSEYLVSLK
jgi:cbb3-type cytochrome oxidase cytochrome c subunit